MARQEHRGASGALELYYKYDESTNEMRDSESSAKIFAQDEEILVLEIYSLSSNVYRRPPIHESKESYWVKVQELIRLIINNGKKIRG